MAAITRTRHRVGLTCDACYARMLVRFTLHHHGHNEDGALLIAVELDHADRVMGLLFGEAHRGPFTKTPPERLHHPDCPHPTTDQAATCPCGSYR